MVYPADAVPFRPELLAPAGDRAAMEAAVRGGADAVYFGLPGFNARARATNFEPAALRETLAYLHGHGVRGYVALNTLVFDDELPRLEAAVRACADAAVDAVIVQDLGVASLVHAVAPSMPMHASTQMTCTDAASVELARSLGASRVILARELSLDDIAAIRAPTDVELEVFVHGALCISYSGQCLTSEAIGGRSANRGACAQACRLPYELVVDGELRDQGEHAYLSPLGPWAEVVVHHPMALFYMEHCVIAATLSDGRDHRTCGRPCEHHRLSLRDRAGMDHPPEADVGCRNTVFHAAPQSAAGLAPQLVAAGVRRFRIELVRERAAEVTRLVAAYRGLIEGARTPAAVLRELRSEGAYGVVRGSLRVIG